MATPTIVWRNPKPIHRVRTWTHVRRDERRTLYLVLESRACGPSSWEGLPTLEIIRTRGTARLSNAKPNWTRIKPGA